jgi:hypothetical protein
MTSEYLDDDFDKIISTVSPEKQAVLTESYTIALAVTEMVIDEDKTRADILLMLIAGLPDFTKEEVVQLSKDLAEIPPNESKTFSDAYSLLVHRILEVRNIEQEPSTD